MPIKRLLMLMTTANEANAETNSPIELQITPGGGSSPVVFEIPNTPQREQERAQANFYFVRVRSPFFTKRSLNPDSIRLKIKGDDAWLPSSFFLFGLDDAVGPPELLVPLVHLQDWPYGWLSTDPRDIGGTAKPVVTLPLV